MATTNDPRRSKNRTLNLYKFPGVENHKADPFMEGYWEGLGDGFKLGDSDARRGSVIGILLGAFSGGLVGAGVTIIIVFLTR